MAEFKVQEFGEALRLIRGSLSQMKVEVGSGVDQHTVSNLERGKTSSPTFVNVIKLATFYGLTPNDISALAGLYVPDGTEDDFFPPDVARELQHVRQLMLDLETPNQQRAFANMLRETAESMLTQLQRDELVAKSKLPDYIRRKLVTWPKEKAESTRAG